MTETWSKWENQVVNDAFPLRRFLGKSTHSVVFLTECAALGVQDAAIKLIPEDTASADTQLAYWSEAAALTHPHLIRLLEMGRCRLGGHPFLFLVMEYADQTLAQVLAQRALSGDETRGMLPPVLEALGFLHGNHRVHGQIKPANVLVVGDQVKLSSDNVHPAGKTRPWIASASPYDPPEAQGGAIFPAGDIWGIGVLLCETLTQQLPERPGSATPALPASLPADFVATVSACLRPIPDARDSLAGIEARLSAAPGAPGTATPESATTAAPEPAPVAYAAAPAPPITHSAAPADAAPLRDPPRQQQPMRRPSAGRWWPAAAVMLIAVAWAGWHFRPTGERPESNAALPAPTAAAQPAAAVPPPPNPPPDKPSLVVHQEIPTLSHHTRKSISGIVEVDVRVTVDPAGNVVEATLENHGSSKYFELLSTQAARKWRFAAYDRPESRAWLLQFEFSRSGATANATPRS